MLFHSEVHHNVTFVVTFDGREEYRTTVYLDSFTPPKTNWNVKYTEAVKWARNIIEHNLHLNEKVDI